VIGQCHGDAVTELINGWFVIIVKDDGAAAFKLKVVGEQGTERGDQAGSAIEI